MDKLHFLSPDWLFLFIPLIVILWLLKPSAQTNSAWHKVIEPQLLEHLLVNPKSTSNIWPYILISLTGIISIIAMANPVWEKKPQVVFQTPQARVLVLDLSTSMNAKDLKPSRLVRARLKIQDILNRDTEGQIGLVVFAGDAFSVTPLTRDNETISSQLRVLEPKIMPVQGSRLDLGLLKAGDLLKQAGVSAGDILLIADGYQSNQTLSTIKQLHSIGHRISILGVGTLEGAPLSNGQGDVIRDNNQNPVLAKLEEKQLQKLVKAGGGVYSRIRPDNKDIDYLLNLPELNKEREVTDQPFQQNQWKENGPYLTILLLPFAALAFRRGWLLSLLIVSFITPLPRTAHAFGWEDLWQTPEQQASLALRENRLQEAEELSDNSAIIGSALYKQGKFNDALEHYKTLQGADANYNRGNTLAKLSRYQDAIDAYNKSLEQQPTMQDAIENKAAIEALLKQQQEQKSKQENESNENNESDQQDQSNQKSPSKNSSENSDQEQQEPSNGESNQESGKQDQSGSQKPDTDQQSNQPENQFADANDQMDQQENKPEQKQSSNQENDEEQKQQASQTDKQPPQNTAQTDNKEPQASPLDTEEQIAAEQWLRRIPDDPGGLLKRKFLYQYQQRGRQYQSQQAW